MREKDRSRSRYVENSITWGFKHYIFIGFALLALSTTALAQTADNIDWQKGPATVSLGTLAQLSLPEGYLFTGKDGSARFDQLNENPPDPDELGTVIPRLTNKASDDRYWFMSFTFRKIGYVRDDEKDRLDADAILASIQKNTEESNEYRRQHGWTTLTVVGWLKPPYYDRTTHDLVWAIRGRDSKGRNFINYSTRILGRRGTMNVNIVVSPEYAATQIMSAENVISGFSFSAGERYAEFRAGDRVAEIGLTALIAGGVGAAVVKSGVLTGLLKALWKVVAVVAVAIAAFFKRFFDSILGLFRREKNAAPE